MNEFFDNNTSGYTEAELAALNSEWEAIVDDDNLEPDSEEYDLALDRFQTAVAKRHYPTND